MSDVLISAYPWIKALHIMAVISWMAGLFYLPRLYVYHAERAQRPGELSETLVIMEEKLLRVIMNPAMIASWIFGLCLAATPGVIDWASGWAWLKLAGIVGMTIFHMKLARWRREFAAGENVRNGRYYRFANEVPTLLMVLIVIMAVAKPF